MVVHHEDIGKLNREFMEAFARGDGSAVAAVYSDDAHLLPPGTSPVRGREAIAGFWQSVIDAGGTSLNLETTDLDITGEVAREIGRGDLTVQDSAGSTTTSGLKYVVFWVRTSDGWRYETDIWNAEPNGQE
ncbi:YybH family protein [Rhodococcoides corynebacterioides]|uniref:SgcJ/EcaC family oxidoreductase n=1 Tax=Rhodococcoides corynebacterioides TaxID=53972 RepID=A0ABS7NYJ9_9NOCA|nr:SgcJ/EcaC family oxidoreductase [Rhodococcus corynebacterioides]MBY6348962.1 SgcJ/EcaC family oxidoreductase [Rhodococcus corynebacterioides]MBY6365221.1 SgcJ/EcaC family oxidoreductase [Rhodococcus corynebacterioides]MBY6406633.1 SgcJ/EcaC family oxidoreductase [Rhodococcus corynebacterioides]